MQTLYNDRKHISVFLTLLEGVGEGQSEEIIRGPEEALRLKNMYIFFIVTTSLVHASGKA